MIRREISVNQTDELIFIEGQVWIVKQVSQYP